MSAPQHLEWLRQQRLRGKGRGVYCVSRGNLFLFYPSVTQPAVVSDVRGRPSGLRQLREPVKADSDKEGGVLISRTRFGKGFSVSLAKIDSTTALRVMRRAAGKLRIHA